MSPITFEKFSDSRISTFHWIKHLFNMEENHKKILEEFESSYDLSDDIDLEAPPVNIICFDGGGLKGYAILAVLDVIIEKLKKKGIDSDDFHQQYFDLLAGTSVGGCAALVGNRLDTSKEVMKEMEYFVDEARKHTFSNFDVLNFLRTGALVKKQHQVKSLVAKRYGKDLPLKSDGVPTFVMTAVRNDHECIHGQMHSGHSQAYKPFVLRTYDYPKDTIEKRKSVLVDSSSDVKFYEACAATSAVPGLMDEVTVKVDGQQKSLADGMLYCNCPLVVALQEARYLYPERPLGVVISVGYGNNQNEFVNRAIEVARLSNPNLHFQRICPSDILEKFSATETNMDKISRMRTEVKDYMRTDPRTKRVLEVTLEKLLQQKRDKKRARNEKLLTNTFRQKNQLLPLLKSMKVGPHGDEDTATTIDDDSSNGSDFAFNQSIRMSIREVQNNIDEEREMLCSTSSCLDMGILNMFKMDQRMLDFV